MTSLYEKLHKKRLLLVNIAHALRFHDDTVIPIRASLWRVTFLTAYMKRSFIYLVLLSSFHYLVLFLSDFGGFANVVVDVSKSVHHR